MKWNGMDKQGAADVGANKQSPRGAAQVGARGEDGLVAAGAPAGAGPPLITIQHDIV